MIDIPQSEADELLVLEKYRADDITRDFLIAGSNLVVPLISPVRREDFLLDLRKASINLMKVKFQTRARTTLVLARIDFSGGFHTNPDGQDIGHPHIHLYREGFGDKWAFPLASLRDQFPQPDDHWTTFQNFLDFCHVAVDHRPLFTRNFF